MLIDPNNTIPASRILRKAKYSKKPKTCWRCEALSKNRRSFPKGVAWRWWKVGIWTTKTKQKQTPQKWCVSKQTFQPKRGEKKNKKKSDSRLPVISDPAPKRDRLRSVHVPAPALKVQQLLYLAVPNSVLAAKALSVLSVGLTVNPKIKPKGLYLGSDFQIFLGLRNQGLSGVFQPKQHQPNTYTLQNMDIEAWICLRRLLKNKK